MTAERDPLAARLDAETPELAALRSANVTLERQLAEAKAKTTQLVEAVYAGARDAAVTAGRPKSTTPKPDKRAKGEEVALLHCTDWQGGKKTITFNLDVLASRIGVLAEKVERLTAIQRHDHPVRRCVLMLGGDMVEGGGNIFPGQAHEIDASLYGQLFRVARIIEQLITDLSSVYEHVEVVAEWGNHGRLGRKGDLPAQDNADLILYHILADRTSSDRVSWQFGTDWYQMVTVGDYRALLVHGDEISTASQHPVYAISRHVTNWATGSLPRKEMFSDCYQGHRHRHEDYVRANGDYIYLTGSPESGNQYASQHLSAQGRPSQRLHFVDPAAGRVTSPHLVWLD